MEWEEEVEPIVKPTPRLQASIYVNKDRKVRLRLTFSEGLLNDLKRPTKASIMFGKDENGVALCRLLIKEDGKFPFHDLGRGGSRIHGVPAPATVPQEERDVQRCEIRSVSPTEVIFELPVAEWTRKPTMPAAIPPNTSVSTAPKKPEPVNVVNYLKNKGIDARKTPRGWVIAEEFHTPTDTLMVVNRHRSAAGLPHLGPGEII